MNGVRCSVNAVRRFVRKFCVFCSVAVLFGMGSSCGAGCFVQRFVRPQFVDLVLHGILFRISVLFGHVVLFGVLFAKKMFCSFCQVWAEQRSCSLNNVRAQS